MKQIRQHIINGILLLAIAGISSCESVLEDGLSTTEAIGQNVKLSFTRSNASAVTGSFNVLLFSNNYSTVETLSSEERIDTYKENPWDTGKPYPLSGQVHVVGYSPIENIDLTTSNEVAISINNSQQPGTIDVCASQTETGSKSSPLNKDKSLKFAHLTTKISFYAMRHKHMENSRTVGNIGITVPHEYATDKWTYTNGGTFAPATASKVFGDISLKFADQLVTINKEYLVGTCYLNLDGKSILEAIQIAADIAPVGSPDTEKVSKTENIQLMNESGSYQSATNIGEAYKVIIRFTQNSFTLEAVKEEWLPGGLITIPIDPDKSDSK